MRSRIRAPIMARQGYAKPSVVCNLVRKESLEQCFRIFMSGSAARGLQT